jgi:hypothetical protein
MIRKKFNKPKSLTTHMLLEGKPINRAMLASVLGMQYSGNRDLYQALGYPLITELKFEDYLARYLRQDIAKAVINRPVRATWQGPLELIESEKTEDTAFEEAWHKLDRELSLKTKLARLDRLTGIGRYGILLLGLDDVSSREGFKTPVKTGKRELKYVRPFSEKSAKIVTYEEKPTSERYGLPLIYDIEVAESSGATSFVQVHYSRVLHVTDEPLESEIFGLPRLEGIYNRLLDLDKIVGGDAEMFWRGARPGYEGKVDPEYQMTPAAKEALQDQLDEYENNLRRFLINEGIEIKALVQQISDPESHVNVILKCISAETGIPLRVLTGSERGELASTQDTSEWKEYVQIRREEQAEPNIIRPLVKILIQYEILPAPTSEDYTVKWNDLYSLSEKARVEVGKGRATALREYTYSPIAETILPPDAFLDICMGLTTDQISLVRKQRDVMISQDELYSKILEGLEEPEPAPIVAPAGKGKPMTRKPAKPAVKK